jgi:hypothetical protein
VKSLSYEAIFKTEMWDLFLAYESVLVALGEKKARYRCAWHMCAATFQVLCQLQA